jgi:ribonuclease D
VFHAAEYDLFCMRRDFGFDFASLFDTMIAADILGRESIGLGALLETEFDVRLEKRYQRANWGQRPLPQHLLSYARLDTHYLLTLRKRLREELLQRELWQLAKEDFRRLEKVRLNGDGRFSDEDKNAACWRIRGSFDLEPQQAAVLLQLCQYRDRVARLRNQPLFKVMADRTLLTIAEYIPVSLNDLSQLSGMNRNQLNRHGPHMLKAVQQGLQDKPIYPPRPPRPNGRFHERLEALRSWRKATARDMGVKSNVVLPRDLLLTIAKTNPHHHDELEVILNEVPWRMEHFGNQILSILSYQNTSKVR